MLRRVSFWMVRDVIVFRERSSFTACHVIILRMGVILAKYTEAYYAFAVSHGLFLAPHFFASHDL